MAFPTTGLLDNFSRANEGPPPSASYLSGFVATDSDGARVSSNQLVPNTATWCSAIWGTTFSTDQEIYVTNRGGDFAPIYLFARLTNPSAANMTGYFLDAHGGDTWAIDRYDSSSSATQLGASVTQTYVNNDKIGFELVGSTLKGYRYTGATWSEIISRTDATYAPEISYLAPRLGSNSIYDDFGGGAYVVQRAWLSDIGLHLHPKAWLRTP